MMKSIVKGITTLGLFCVCILYGYSLNAQNLVSNGGLETWTVPNIPDDWDKYEEASEETIQVFEGTSSVKHAAGTSDLAQVITVTGGEEYTISYHYFDNDTEARSRIWSYWRTDGSNITDVNEGLRPGTYSSDSGDWQELSLTLTAPEAANELYFEVRTYNDNGASDTGFIYYDSFSVESTVAASSIQFTNLEEGQEITTGEYDFEFDFTNYALTSDGTPFPEIVRLYIDDVLTESVTTVSPMTVDLAAGAHTARLELINLVISGETPILATADINFTVADEVLPPTLAITGITEDDVLVVDNFNFGTDITNFTVAAPSDGDGYIVYYIDSEDNTDLFDADASTAVTGLSNGLHTLTVSLVDNAGNPLVPEVTQTVGFEVAVPVVLEPALAITGIAEDDVLLVDNFNFGTDVTDFTVAAASAGDGYIVYNIDDGVEAQIFDADASTLVSGLSNGLHILTVTLVDNAGVALDPPVSQSVGFEIAVPASPSLEGTYFVTGDDLFITTDIQNFTVAAPSDGDGYIVFNLDGVTTDIYDADATTEFLGLSNGAHNLVVSLVDNAGEPLDPEVSETLNFTVDTGETFIAFVSPLEGAELIGGDIDFEFSISNYDFGGPTPFPDVVQLYIDDVLVESVNSGSSLTTNITDLGAHTAKLVLTNLVTGDFDPAVEATINFTIIEEVILEPTLSFVAPLDGAELAPGSIDFEYLLEDYTLGENDLVELFIDDVSVGSTSDTNTISSEVTELGAHTAKFVLTNSVTGDFDPAVEASINFTIAEPSTDPAISFVDPLDGAELDAGTIDFEFLIENFDFGGEFPSPDIVELYIDDELITTVNTGNTISASVTEAGAHTATLVITNLVTGDFDPSIEATINFTVIASVDPLLSVVAPTEGSEFYPGSIDFEYLLENYTLGENDLIELYIDDVLAGSATDETIIAADVTELGAHTATFVLTNSVSGDFDPAVEASVGFTVVALPTLSVVAPTEGADLLPGSIDFEYLLENYILGENDLIELYIDDVLAGSATDATVIAADVTETGAHTATFVLTNSVSGDFTPTVDATVDFTVTAPLVDQEVEVANGWSIISINVEPVDADISSVMAPIVDDIFIVKDQIGNVYWPEFAVNSIGDVDVRYGYQLKADLETSVTVTGVAVDPATAIPVTEGWNIIGYLPNYSLFADVAMAGIVDDVVIVKDEGGNVYWPAFGINNIGLMNAGKGFQIKMFADRDLVYPEAPEDAPKFAGPVKLETPVYYNKTSNTGTNMIIGIPANAWPTTPELGDELAVLDAAGNVAGSVVYAGENTAITVWGDDEVTTDKDGLLDGEQIRLQYWNKADNKEWIMDVEWIEGDDYYVSDGIHIAGSISLREAAPEAIRLLANMPNPFTETTNLRFYTESNESVKVQVYNALGALVLEDVITIDAAGYQEYTIDAKDMNSGAYFYHLSNSEFTTTGKMSLIK